MPTTRRRRNKTERNASGKPFRHPKTGSGVKGIGRYQHSDARQVNPENMPAWIPGIIRYTIADIPRQCCCTWVPRHMPGNGIFIYWELKFSYALCASIHSDDRRTSVLATSLPA